MAMSSSGWTRSTASPRSGSTSTSPTGHRRAASGLATVVAMVIGYLPLLSLRAAYGLGWPTRKRTTASANAGVSAGTWPPFGIVQSWTVAPASHPDHS